ncbi:MAG: HAD-IC family P-type ATPase [Methanocorpusculum sp.]|nr:HAD-IC family P-type ATPase [Methanocorpusculum sp.]
MSIAVVFDSAGTLLKTVRSVIDINKRTLLDDSVETTTLTFDDYDRILVLLNIGSTELMQAESSKLLSAYLTENEISFGISCGRKILDADIVGKILYTDEKCLVSDMQTVIKSCRETVTKEAELFAMNVGLIVNLRKRDIEFAIAAAGHPFPGVREMISELHKKGIAAYIASGDRTAKLELVADKIGIPRNRVHGVSTPVIKAQVVTNLKSEYDVVVMVGDGINDLSAMKSADVAVLSIQQSGIRPDILYKQADYTVKDIREVVKILDDLSSKQTN